MTPTLLHAVARRADALTPDADLLARYAREGDHPAFEELVRRHGPLVWAVCRQMLPHRADAEDAFQAVFLALVRSAAAIRDGRTLPAWLHGIAVRVATRARREFARRRAREERASIPEADRPVPDAAWEALAAAVHEEVQRLPDAERTAFVLCELEGVSQADAAARLGWPLGSVSGRLCKARQRLLERLTARGVAPAVAVGIGTAAAAAGTVPAHLFAGVKVFPSAPAAASSVATALARGLTEGVAMRTKLMAATAVAVAALGLTGGAVVLSRADAQPGPGGGTGTGGAGVPGGIPGIGVPVGTPSPMTFEYKLVDIRGERADFGKVIMQQGKDGWEFCGSERFAMPMGMDTVLVFKKRAVGPPQGPGGTGGLPSGGIPPAGAKPAVFLNVFTLKNAKAEEMAKVLKPLFPNTEMSADPRTNSVLVRGDEKVLDEIRMLISRLEAVDPVKPQ